MSLPGALVAVALLLVAGVLPVAAAQNTSPTSAPSTDYEMRIDQTSVLVSHEYLDGEMRLVVRSEVPKIAAVSDVFSGASGSADVSRIYVKRIRLERGVNHLNLPATKYKGTAIVSLSTGTEGVNIIHRGGASNLFTGPASWQYARISALAALAAAFTVTLGVYVRRRYGGPPVRRVD